MSKVILGYTYWSEPGCPYCGSTYIAIHDDGREDSYQAVCWCGAKARCRKDDPELVERLAALATPEPS